MRRAIAIASVIATICGAGSNSARAERFDAYFLDENRLSEIEAVGMGPLSDAWEIYKEFAKRFSFLVTEGDQSGTRNIQKIVEAGGGDRNALTFLLLNLFRWNGIDAELALLSTKRGTELDDAYIEHVLVYVPALKQYFDPTLPPAAQPSSSDHSWRQGRRRMHFAAALWYSGKQIGRCSSSCLYSYGRIGTGGEPLPYAVPVKTVPVPGTDRRGGGSPQQ